MWSFFADPMIAVLVVGTLLGADRVGAEAAGRPSPARSEDIRAALAAESLVEVGTQEEMGSMRDRAWAVAAEAREELFAAGTTSPAALPDSVAVRWIGTATAAYARALRQEAVRLHDGAAADGTFQSLWSEMARTHLEILKQWPRLWLEDAARGDPASFVPGQLLLLCSPEAYEGESFELPRGSLSTRMATLPESLAQCCIDAHRCVGQLGALCPDQVTADIARLADLDALIGFRNGRRYWALPAGVAPRSRSNDAAVARAQANSALEMLQACAGSRPNCGAPAAAVPAPAALAELRDGGKLWPPESDPFRSVPGLRNPRCDGEGRLICDLSVSEGCLAVMHPTSLARLTGRLAPGARIIPVRPNAPE